MASDQQQIGFRADADTAERLDRFKRRTGAENQTQAIQEMIRIADRETRAPLLYRAKDQIIRWAELLAVVAVTAVIGGFATTAIAPLDGLLMGGVLAAMAGGLVACLELARIAFGANRVGERLREVVG